MNNIVLDKESLIYKLVTQIGNISAEMFEREQVDSCRLFWAVVKSTVLLLGITLFVCAVVAFGTFMVADAIAWGLACISYSMIMPNELTIAFLFLMFCVTGAVCGVYVNKLFETTVAENTVVQDLYVGWKNKHCRKVTVNKTQQ